MFAWYALLFRSALNLWNVLNLWSRFPLRYVEDDICVICVNFLNLGDKGLEYIIIVYSHMFVGISCQKLRDKEHVGIKLCFKSAKFLPIALERNKTDLATTPHQSAIQHINWPSAYESGRKHSDLRDTAKQRLWWIFTIYFGLIRGWCLDQLHMAKWGKGHKLVKLVELVEPNCLIEHVKMS